LSGRRRQAAGQRVPHLLHEDSHPGGVAPEDATLQLGHSRRHGASLSRHQLTGLDTEQLMLVFVETGWENWSFGGGRLLHV
jgi:hypothetical protein